MNGGRSESNIIAAVMTLLAVRFSPSIEGGEILLHMNMAMKKIGQKGKEFQ